MSILVSYMLSPFGDTTVSGVGPLSYPYISTSGTPTLSAGRSAVPAFWTTGYAVGEQNIGPLGDNEVRTYNQSYLATIFMSMFFQDFGLSFPPAVSGIGGGGVLGPSSSGGTLA